MFFSDGCSDDAARVAGHEEVETDERGHKVFAQHVTSGHDRFIVIADGVNNLTLLVVEVGIWPNKPLKFQRINRHLIRWNRLKRYSRH